METFINIIAISHLRHARTHARMRTYTHARTNTHTHAVNHYQYSGNNMPLLVFSPNITNASNAHQSSHFV